MKGIVLDTHTWIWFSNDPGELPKSINKTINEAIQNSSLHISAISLWEIGMLEVKKRITLKMPCLEWINQFIELTHAHIVPITPAIAVESCNLPNGFHEDPADRIIVATARIESLILLTRDERILSYSKNKYLAAMKV